MNDIQLNFIGPLSFRDDSSSVFRSASAASAGVYLWTFRQEKSGEHLIHYVGETKFLAKRHRVHLINILGMNYGIFDPLQAKQGVRKELWKGLWRERSPDGPCKLLAIYTSLSSSAADYVNEMNIFFAPFDGDTNTRKHIEGSIGWRVRNEYADFKALYPDDNHIGTSATKLGCRLIITASEKILGLAPEVEL